MMRSFEKVTGVVMNLYFEREREKRQEKEELILWLEARDCFTGLNFQKKDLARGLALAKRSKHPDAVWICSLVKEGWPPESLIHSLQLEAQNGDPRASVFLGLLTMTASQFMFDKQIKTAASAGNPLAMAVCPLAHHQVEADFRKRAAAAHEPSALFWLWENDSSHLEALQEAAELGWVRAQFQFALQLDANDPKRYELWYERFEGVIFAKANKQTKGCSLSQRI